MPKVKASLSPIYASLSIPAGGPSPHFSCLQWSGDGQLLFSTKNNLHLLSPDHSSILQASSKEGDIDEPASWIQTMIEFDKTRLRNWPESSQSWGAVSLGSLDIGIRSVACSPSSVTEAGGCVIAILSTNMDLSLWSAGRDMYKGKWDKLHEITPMMPKQSRESKTSRRAQTLQAQITCITWSSQADFGITPAPCLDGSLLVAGTRAGTLVFFRVSRNSTVQHICSVKVAQTWVTHLAFTSWKVLKEGACVAELAYGTSHGSVGIVALMQILEPSLYCGAFGPNFTIDLEYEIKNHLIFNSDGRCLSALTWVTSIKNDVLIICKPGVLHMWSSHSPSGWSGYRSLSLQTQKISSGASRLNPISGMYYISSEDILIICVSDGSIHAIQSFSSDPSWKESETDEEINRERLSKMSRSIFSRTEKQTTRADMNRISGFVSYDGHGDVTWVHESCQPKSFGYTYNAHRHSTLVTARLYKRPHYDVFLHRLFCTLNSAKTTSGQSSHYLLRPYFLYLLKHKECYEELISLLRCPSVKRQPIKAKPIRAKCTNLTIRDDFRSSLRTEFFGFDMLLQLRLRFCVAEFLSIKAEDPRIKCQATELVSQLLGVISQLLVRIIANHLATIARTLTAEDAPFVTRILCQALQLESGALPSSDDEETTNIIRIALSSLGISEKAMEERCPACDAAISLEGGIETVCINGHSWHRCSITSFILSTSMARKCSLCSRKSFKPLSSRVGIFTDMENWLPKLARSWVVEEVLEAANQCLICGNNFVSPF